MTDVHLSSYTKQLSIDLGYPNAPEEDGKGLYEFDFSDNLSIYIGSLQPGFYFFSKLGKAPAQNCEDFFSMVMHANLFGQGTGGSVIGLDDEGKILTLSLALAYQMPYPQFKEHVEDFVNYVDLWQKKTSDASSSPA